MRNLLSANLMRLRRSRILWLCLAYALYDGLRLFYNAAQMVGEGTSRWAPSFQFLFLGGIAFGLYGSFFISGEYGDGGLRNKLVVGTRRSAVYLANWISCTAACLLMCGAYILPNWVLEYFLVGSAGHLEYICTPGQIALLLVELVFVAASFNAIFTMIGMNIQNKTGGPVAVFLTAAALIYFGHDGRTMLLLYETAPEHYRFSPLTMLRYRLCAEWLPGGQALHCVDLGTVWAPEGMILRALAVIAITSAAGLAMFQRKDLK